MMAEMTAVKISSVLWFQRFVPVDGALRPPGHAHAGAVRKAVSALGSDFQPAGDAEHLQFSGEDPGMIRGYQFVSGRAADKAASEPVPIPHSDTPQNRVIVGLITFSV